MEPDLRSFVAAVNYQYLQDIKYLKQKEKLYINEKELRNIPVVLYCDLLRKVSLNTEIQYDDLAEKKCISEAKVSNCYANEIWQQIERDCGRSRRRKQYSIREAFPGFLLHGDARIVIMFALLICQKQILKERWAEGVEDYFTDSGLPEAETNYKKKKLLKNGISFVYLFIFETDENYVMTEYGKEKYANLCDHRYQEIGEDAGEIFFYMLKEVFSGLLSATDLEYMDLIRRQTDNF